MYAVIKSGGKQYKVSPGDVVRVEKLGKEAGTTVEFSEVLAVNNDENLVVGSPLLANACVSGTVVETGKAKKVLIFKYKRKKQYKVFRGHRQRFTAVKIDAIKGS
ncbi:MAG: 50S ribosomal protein L21 [Acidobacteria bacterium]|nr:50S ribosomal protein L21 [Acidobacteriota bacterium]